MLMETQEMLNSPEDLNTQREYNGRLLLRIPKELHKALAEAAKANGVSLN